VEKTTDFPTDSNFIDFLLIFHRFHCCFPVIAGAKAVLSTLHRQIDLSLLFLLVLGRTCPVQLMLLPPFLLF
jgi:hypothetical protein